MTLQNSSLSLTAHTKHVRTFRDNCSLLLMSDSAVPPQRMSVGTCPELAQPKVTILKITPVMSLHYSLYAVLSVLREICIHSPNISSRHSIVKNSLLMSKILEVLD